ncbi:uncharacterized protein V1518DRAFT_409585 [Limtongia smithiae]|uniref:uncharacterized protein n=1 Tax=Limtongia smithiae TaxID=1125753 RepID=UPI0034D00519
MRALAAAVLVVLYTLTAVVLIVRMAPALHPLLRHGKTLPTAASREPAPSHALAITALFTRTLPKAYFSHFYPLGASISAALLLVLVLAPTGAAFPLLRLLLRADALLPVAPSTSSAVPLSHASIACALMLLHCLRRTYETRHLDTRPNPAARIRFGHYLVGIVFYIVTPLALVCDALISALPPRSQSPTYKSPPSHLSQVCIAAALFAVFSVVQFTAHAQLACLHKYSPPPPSVLFKHTLCPHYAAEIGLYFTLAWICNFSPATVAVTVWTFINLAVSAEQSRKFYIAQFGPAAVANKWNILPFVF